MRSPVLLAQGNGRASPQLYTVIVTYGVSQLGLFLNYLPSPPRSRDIFHLPNMYTHFSLAALISPPDMFMHLIKLSTGRKNFLLLKKLESVCPAMLERTVSLLEWTWDLCRIAYED
jgi:hypothetical protein